MVSRKEKLERLAEDYRRKGFEVLGVEVDYPLGAEKHELIGSVDLIVERPETPSLKLIQSSYIDTSDPETVERRRKDKREQAEKAAEYFENRDLDYKKVEPEVVLRPEGDLEALKEIWEDTKGVFSWSQAVEAVSEEGRLGGLKDEVIVEWVEAPPHHEKYEIDEEYEDLIDLFVEGKI